VVVAPRGDQPGVVYAGVRLAGTRAGHDHPAMPIMYEPWGRVMGYWTNGAGWAYPEYLQTEDTTRVRGGMCRPKRSRTGSRSAADGRTPAAGTRKFEEDGT